MSVILGFLRAQRPLSLGYRSLTDNAIVLQLACGRICGLSASEPVIALRPLRPLRLCASA